MNQEILDKSLNYYNYLHAKKMCDIEDGFRWSNDKNPVIIPKYVPTKVEKWSAGMWNFLKEIIKDLRP